MRRPRVAYANVASTVALFVSLGGASYAALQIPRDSVGTAQLRRGAVTNAKVKEHSLRASAFARGQIPAGKRGPAGPSGTAHLTIHTAPLTYVPCAGACSVSVTPAPPGNVQGGVTCPSGERATGGGYNLEGSPVTIVYSVPHPGLGGAPDGWSVSGNTTSPTGPYGEVWAVCAAP